MARNRLLVVTNKTVIAVRPSNGSEVWRGPVLGAQAPIMEFDLSADDLEEREEGAEEKEEADLDSRTAALAGPRVRLHAPDKHVYLFYEQSVLILDVRQGAPVSPPPPPRKPLAQRKAEWQAAVDEGRAGKAGAAFDFVHPPLWSTQLADKQRLPSPVLPRFDEVSEALVLETNTPGEPRLIIAGFNGGLYAWDANMRPMWQYYLERDGAARPAGFKPKRIGKYDAPHDDETLTAFRRLLVLEEEHMLVGMDDDSSIHCLFLGKNAEGSTKRKWTVKVEDMGLTDAFLDKLAYLPGRGQLLVATEEGSVAGLLATDGGLTFSVQQSLLRGQTTSCTLVPHAPGTTVQRALRQPRPAHVHTLTEADDATCPWDSSQPAQGYELFASVVLSSDIFGAVMTLEILGPAGSANVAPVQAKDIANPLVGAAVPGGSPPTGEPGAVQQIGMLQAVPQWLGKSRSAEYSEKCILSVPDAGMVIVGKDRGEIEAWNITSGAQADAKAVNGPKASAFLRWQKFAMDYAHIAAPWELAVDGPVAAPVAVTQPPPAATGSGAAAGGSDDDDDEEEEEGGGGRSARKAKAQIEDLSDFDVAVGVVAPKAGLVLTLHGSMHVRAWTAATGQLAWVRHFGDDDTLAPYKDNFHAVVFTPTGSEQELCAFNMELDEVPYLVIVDTRSGQMVQATALTSKPETAHCAQSLHYLQDRGCLVVSYELDVPEMEEIDDEDEAEREARQDEFNRKPVVLFTVQAPGSGSAAAGAGAGGLGSLSPEELKKGRLPKGNPAADPAIIHRLLLEKHGVGAGVVLDTTSGMAIIPSYDSAVTGLSISEGAVAWQYMYSLAAQRAYPHPEHKIFSWSSTHFIPEQGRLLGLLSGSAKYDAPPESRAETMSDGALLVCLDVKTGFETGRVMLDVPASNVEIASSDSLIAVVQAGVGVSLRRASNLQLLHEYPYEFSGVPALMAFVQANKAFCCDFGGSIIEKGGPVKPGQGAAGTLPRHLLILGTGGEAVSLDVAGYLGPLHASPQVDLAELTLEPPGLKQTLGVVMPTVQMYIALVLLVVDFLQMVAFAFSDAAKVPPGQEDAQSTLSSVQGFGLDITVGFSEVFITVVVFVLLFLITISFSERIEAWAFVNKESTNAQLAWQGMTFLAKLMTSILLIPITRVLVTAFDCTEVGGKLTWDGEPGQGVVCYEGSHMVLAILGGVTLLLYFPLVVRLILVGNDLSGVELDLVRFWDWSGDDRSDPPREHFLSERNSYYGPVQAFVKLLASILSVLLGAQQAVAATLLVVLLGVGLLITSLVSPRYYYASASKLRTALDAGVLWTYVCSFVATAVIQGGADVSNAGLNAFLTYLPAVILLIVPAVLFWQWQRPDLCTCLKAVIPGANMFQFQPKAYSIDAPSDALAPGVGDAASAAQHYASASVAPEDVEMAMVTHGMPRAEMWTTKTLMKGSMRVVGQAEVEALMSHDDAADSDDDSDDDGGDDASEDSTSEGSTSDDGASTSQDGKEGAVASDGDMGSDSDW